MKRRILLCMLFALNSSVQLFPIDDIAAGAMPAQEDQVQPVSVAQQLLQASHAPHHANETTAYQCMICLDVEQITPLNPLQTLACGHTIHRKCLNELFSHGNFSNVKCPVCRAFIPESYWHMGTRYATYVLYLTPALLLNFGIHKATSKSVQYMGNKLVQAIVYYYGMERSFYFNPAILSLTATIIAYKAKEIIARSIGRMSVQLFERTRGRTITEDEMYAIAWMDRTTEKISNFLGLLHQYHELAEHCSLQRRAQITLRQLQQRIDQLRSEEAQLEQWDDNNDTDE